MASLFVDHGTGYFRKGGASRAGGDPSPGGQYVESQQLDIVAYADLYLVDDVFSTDEFIRRVVTKTRKAQNIASTDVASQGVRSGWSLQTKGGGFKSLSTRCMT